MEQSSTDTLLSPFEQYGYAVYDANGNHMRPLPNNSGADIRLHFPKSQRFDALKRFYDNYPLKYWDARRGFYRNNHIMRQWRPW